MKVFGVFRDTFGGFQPASDMDFWRIFLRSNAEPVDYNDHNAEVAFQPKNIKKILDFPCF